jgi:hypothetical protein
VPEAPVINRPPITCSLNERLVDDNCICLDGFYVIQGVCTECAAPNYYDEQNGICRPKCGQNQVLDFNSLTCICISGFYDINGNCGGCGAFAVYNARTKSCDCIQGYTLNSGNCIPATRAPLRPRGPDILPS